VEDDEAHEGREDYGRSLVEEEADSVKIRMKSQPAQREHFPDETASRLRLHRLSESRKGSHGGAAHKCAYKIGGSSGDSTDPDWLFLYSGR